VQSREDYSTLPGGDSLKSVKNLAASVHQRLENVARETSRPFNDIVQYYALERWLYRLSQSDYHDRFVLKGALMLLVWETPMTRPTRDIDLLGRIKNNSESISAFVAEVCRVPVEDDAMAFDGSRVSVQRITEDADYAGMRAKFRGSLGNTRVPMQIDIGFSDIVTPEPTLITYPTILELPSPVLTAYNRETTIAEKFQAMVKLGELNSRMKDFFDVRQLASTYDFGGERLAEAIKQTFAQRQTEIESEPFCFTSDFAHDPTKQRQWDAFIRRSALTKAPLKYPEVVEGVKIFLQPPAAAVQKGEPFRARWVAGTLWK
jgi:predicted nucleotidyltransferase component of viral defense system